VQVHIKIAQSACVGISEDAIASARAQHSKFAVVFAANGTGCLTATWTMEEVSPPLEIAGMMAGDRLDLAMRDSGGALQSYNGTCIANGERYSDAQGAGASLLLNGLETAQFDWNVSAKEVEYLPSGLLYPALGDTSAAGAIPDFSPEHTAASTPSAVILRARVAPTTWTRLSPIILEADALAPGIPQRRVALAPGQPLRYENHILLAKQLVNGQSVTQPTACHQICYVQPPELKQSNISWAGLDLIADTAIPLASCYEVEQCRQRLLQYTASRSGMLLVTEPALRMELGGLSIAVTAYEPGIWRATVPENIPANPLRIVSRSVCACDTTLFPLEDNRILGVALTDIVIHSTTGPRHLALDHPAWTGMYRWEFRRGRARRWTNGLASLPSEVHQLHGGETIELHIAAVGHYWVDAALDELGQAA